VPREFHLDETHFISLFLNTTPCHQKCQRGNLFNANETHMKLSLRLWDFIRLSWALIMMMGHHINEERDEKSFMGVERILWG
jgi:hypothetical protein